MRVDFVKMHGLGNDFVVFDERAGALGLSAARAAAIADRRTGVGCDQFIALEAAAGADAFMRIRNPDGSEAEACGNATRCVAALLHARGGGRRVVIRTRGGDLASEVLADGRVRVDMGRPRLDADAVPVRADDTLHVALGGHDAACCSMGNPHATIFVADLAGEDVAGQGAGFEADPRFPARANIGFAQVLGPDRIRLRVWERGAGLTPACGSGACAALVNAHRRGLTGREAEVTVDGGRLEIAWDAEDRVWMTGPVATAFEGRLDLAAFPA